jgi:hypothetical protein
MHLGLFLLLFVVGSLLFGLFFVHIIAILVLAVAVVEFFTFIFIFKHSRLLTCCRRSLQSREGAADADALGGR